MTHPHLPQNKLTTLLVLVAAGYCSTVTAGIEEIQPISFGSFVVTGNDLVSTLTVPSSNLSSSTSTQKIHILMPGQNGIYRLTGMPINTSVSINIPNSFITWNGTGTRETFLIEDFEYPSQRQTNGIGETEFYVGATLKTTGTTGIYYASPYSGNILIQVNW